jgi:hypothetical protein
MSSFLFLRVIWEPHHIQFPLRIAGANIKELRITPEPNHPFGRKGLALERAWEQIAPPNCLGMLILDGDVVIDPQDFILMAGAIGREPGAVHVGAARIWSASKPELAVRELSGWSWAHWGEDGPTHEMIPEEQIKFFTFNFTYLPASLVEASIKRGLKGRMFPGVDTFVSKTAREMRTPIRVVAGASPKHLNY